MCVNSLNKQIGRHYTVLKGNFNSKKLTFSFYHSAVNLIVGWNEIISLLNSFSDSSPSSLIKNISPIYLQETLGFFLTLSKIFYSKVAIRSIGCGGANFVQIAVPRIYL